MKYLTPLLFSFTLVACGGGEHEGGSSAGVLTLTSATATAQGYWSGSNAAGQNVLLAILDNGEVWGVYTSNKLPVGGLQGSVAYAGNTLSGVGYDFNTALSSVSRTSYTGSFVASSTISVTTTAGSVLTAKYDAGYDQSPSMANLAGTFTGGGVTGTGASPFSVITVSALGTITGTSAGCALAGTAVARPSGKNSFDVSLAFSGSACALGNGTTANGFAYYDATARQLISMSLNGAKTDGFIYSGTKP